jgi:uncharacterized cupin superfamily protein
MNKINTNTLPEFIWESPKKKYTNFSKLISEALGREPESTDLNKRHPFDVEIARLPAGKILCPYHSHSAQWEFYHVISGRGQVRHEGGLTEIEPGDAFLFKPGEAHTLINHSEGDLTYYVISNNPIGESWHYPDSKKWSVSSPERCVIRSEPIDYFEGEE